MEGGLEEVGRICGGCRWGGRVGGGLEEAREAGTGCGGYRRLQRALGLTPTIPPSLLAEEVLCESLVSGGRKRGPAKLSSHPAHLLAVLISRADLWVMLSLNQLAIL